jgi:hypothetical protein
MPSSGMPRNIFRPKRVKVPGELIKLQNEELRDLYSSPTIIRIIKLRRIRWAGHVTRIRATRTAYRLLVVKREGKRILGKPIHRCIDNIKLNLVQI